MTRRPRRIPSSPRNADFPTLTSTRSQDVSYDNSDPFQTIITTTTHSVVHTSTSLEGTTTTTTHSSSSTSNGDWQEVPDITLLQGSEATALKKMNKLSLAQTPVTAKTASPRFTRLLEVPAAKSAKAPKGALFLQLKESDIDLEEMINKFQGMGAGETKFMPLINALTLLTE